MKHFTTEPMHHIIETLKLELQNSNTHDSISFEVINPDCTVSTYAGSIITYNECNYIYRGYKAWTDLAQLLFCKMLTPIKASEHTVVISFQKLDIEESFHKLDLNQRSEKYGVNSPFFSINKNEEPSFVHAYLKALQAVKISDRKSVLNLGVNSGDEFELIRETTENFSTIKFTGIDHCASAISYAKKRFNTANMELIQHNINHLNELKLKRSELLISIGTLQSPGVDFKPLFMSLIQEYLTEDGAVILGFPNSRWIDGEMIYGAKAPNYSYSEMSLVIKDIYFCKKYLQQHRFRVTLTGKDYIFLTATRIKKTTKKPLNL
ncbi:MAG: methyltransferase domain-containing protein [Campylobacterota bacterium]|nr:methyltransferase domain-containing protein [Campylobacterota bacterium]